MTDAIQSGQGKMTCWMAMPADGKASAWEDDGKGSLTYTDPRGRFEIVYHRPRLLEGDPSQALSTVDIVASGIHHKAGHLSPASTPVAAMALEVCLISSKCVATIIGSSLPSDVFFAIQWGELLQHHEHRESSAYGALFNRV